MFHKYLRFSFIDYPTTWFLRNYPTSLPAYLYTIIFARIFILGFWAYCCLTVFQPLGLLPFKFWSAWNFSVTSLYTIVFVTAVLGLYRWVWFCFTLPTTRARGSSLTRVKLYSYSHVCTSHDGLELCPADQNKPKPQPLQLLLKGGGGRHMALSFLRNMTW